MVSFCSSWSGEIMQVSGTSRLSSWFRLRVYVHLLYTVQYTAITNNLKWCCLPDWPPATFISCPLWLPMCCLTVINGRRFQGSLPWQLAEAMWLCHWLQSDELLGQNRPSACRERCFPPDHLIQGPDLVAGYHTFTIRAAFWRDPSTDKKREKVVSSFELNLKTQSWMKGWVSDWLDT